MQSSSSLKPVTPAEHYFHEGIAEFDRFLKSATFSAVSIQGGAVKYLEMQCQTVKREWGCDYLVELIDNCPKIAVKYGEIRFSSYVPAFTKNQKEFHPVTIDYLQSYKNDDWKNVGTHLIQIAYNASKLMGSSSVIAFSLPDAVAFYAKMGFTIDWAAYEDGDEEEAAVSPAVLQRVQASWERCISKTFADKDSIHLLLDRTGQERLVERVGRI